ncbi:MAG: DUF6438 domain-containing protein [Chloroflexi bacterium]|nr:DUF6438 domain-containing protein [Chloroflexota bacterium]MCC6892198.1 hypothetical protein [Anaerolineae bacterium]
MKMFKTVGLLMLISLSMFSAQAQEAAAQPVITLERTACFGTCPIYTLSIFEDGKVVYNGDQFVTVEGEQTSEIAPETVEAMVNAFEEAGYFDWNEAYDAMTVTDMPSAITSVTRDGETHTINHYMGDSSAPLALTFLEHWIDQMTTSSLWTGSENTGVAVWNGSESPVVTLQHGPNFGFGPVYNIVGYADGTVVFVGLANVDKLGVHVMQTDAASIEVIAMQANAFGYFGWQDRYDTMVMTDQAYITSSVQWEDQYKSILRYDGDPNAPIGVLRIEESIERLAADWLPQS